MQQLFWFVQDTSCFHNSILVLLANSVTIHTMIKIPPRIKRVNELFFRSPNKKKLGASDATNKKYPPKAINTKAESKIIFLRSPINTNQLKAGNSFCKSNNKIMNFNLGLKSEKREIVGNYY